jgi:hypothetical protein
MRHHDLASPRHTRVLLGAAALVVAVCVTGCYSKTTAARGFGADTTSIQKGNLPRDDGNRTLGYKSVEFKPIPPKAGN